MPVVVALKILLPLPLVREPFRVALVAVRAPAGVTLNGALLNVAWPNWMPELVALNIELLEPISILTPDKVPPDVISPAVRVPRSVNPLL